VRIWRSAVEATHDFLTPNDVQFYEGRLANEYLKLVDVTVAVADGTPVGFSGVAVGNLEMFFVVQQHRGRGAGSILLRDAMAKHPGLLIDVNEQNPRPSVFIITMVSSRCGARRPMLMGVRFRSCTWAPQCDIAA